MSDKLNLIAIEYSDSDGMTMLLTIKPTGLKCFGNMWFMSGIRYDWHNQNYVHMGEYHYNLSDIKSMRAVIDEVDPPAPASSEAVEPGPVELIDQTGAALKRETRIEAVRAFASLHHGSGSKISRGELQGALDNLTSYIETGKV